MKEIDLQTAQRTDDRALFAPLRDYRDTGYTPLPAGCDQQGRYATRRVNTDGMGPAECCTEIGADDYPHIPRTTSPGLGLLVLAVSAVLSIAAFVHMAGWLGWLS